MINLVGTKSIDNIPIKHLHISMGLLKSFIIYHKYHTFYTDLKEDKPSIDLFQINLFSNSSHVKSCEVLVTMKTCQLL